MVRVHAFDRDANEDYIAVTQYPSNKLSILNTITHYLALSNLRATGHLKKTHKAVTTGMIRGCYKTVPGKADINLSHDRVRQNLRNFH